MSAETLPSKSRRWPYWLGGAVVALLVLLAMAALLGPGIIKSQLIRHGSEILKRPVNVEAVSLNPFTLEVELRGLTLGTLDGQREQIGLDRLNVNVDIKHIARQELAATVAVEHLRWQDDAGLPLFRADTLQVPVTLMGLQENRYEVGIVQLAGVMLEAARNGRGQINLLDNLNRLQASLPPPAQPETPEPPGPPLQWLVAGVDLDQAQIRFTDGQTGGKTPAVQKLDIQHLALRGLEHTLAQPVDLTLAATINETGKLNSQGVLHLQPFAADLKVDLAGLPLQPLQPYIESALNLMLKGGQLDAQAQVTLALPPEKPLQLAVKGDAALRDFASADPLLKEPFLSWKTLAVQGIDIDLGKAAETVRVGQIRFEDFFARLIVSPQGELNVLKIVRQDEPAAAAASAAKPAAAKSGPSIRIGEVAFAQGKVLFSDRFVKPNYTARIERVNGQIKGLSSARNELAEMAVSGRYNQVSPVNVNARLNLLADQRFLDLKAKVTSIEMTSFNPYAGRYAGYNIEKGKLSLDLGYKLEGQQLKAENRIFLDQLTFGDKVDSPVASNLPVRLAVSLLKNRKGEIDINLPISGSLDDPQFSVGGILLQVLGNLIMKAVTAPFSLIASMLGGGDELSTVPFAAGSADLTPDAIKRLGKLAQALDDRPALHLEVTGRADPEADAAALKASKIFKRSVGEDELQRLAQRRAQTTQLWLVEQGKIPAERVFLLPPKLGNDASTSTAEATGKAPVATRVDFSLH